MLLRSFYSLQVLLSAPNKNKTNRDYSVRFFISLVCNRTCDNAGHCLHTPCAPARCAADASLTRINSPVSLLRSFYSLQVLLSAPNKNKTNRNYSVRFFISWFATGLVTMQGIVCTLRVPLHAVQLAQRFASKLARLCYYARFAHYKSCCPHQTRIKRTETIRFVFSYLWFTTGLVTMQGIVVSIKQWE